MSVLLAVVDTNVWVSAFLTPQGTPARLLAAFSKGALQPVYSPEIHAEYLDVLYRRKLNISRDVLAAFMEMLNENGRLVQPILLPLANLPDPDDAPFIAMALHAGCPIITGNTKHFPPETGVKMLSPAEALTLL